MSSPNVTGGSESAPSPDLIFRTLNAHQETAALRAAIELDLFTGIAEGLTTAGELAARSQAAERGVRILCDFLVVGGFLTKEGGSYGLTRDSAMFLDRRSPAYLGTASRFLGNPEFVRLFENLTEVVRRGGTLAGEGTVSEENPVWVDFARGMAPMMAPAAREIPGLIDAAAGARWKVLDLAAGHGLFGIEIAKANPNAEIVALDWAMVLEVAKENAQAAGITGRYRTIAGNAFEAEFGEGYDVVLVTNFYHHFDRETCVKLASKIHRALKPGGKMVTLEFAPNDDRITPPVPAAFALIMLGSTRAGDAYTINELSGMFAEAGFARSEAHQLAYSPQQVIVSHLAG
ncbi:MAG: class I SAM-dependent methyltransferase [Bryobacteraceae bacterium]